MPRDLSKPAVFLVVICLPAMCYRVAHAAEPDEDTEEQLGTIVVTSTRTPTMVRDSALRIETVSAEEIEENATIQPGAVVGLLQELPGVRSQSSAVGLGGATLQLRGLPGRYTLVLADGLPLYGVEPDSFSLLQSPPLDLARAEVIIGSASALYGGGALGGVLNLISQTPDAEPAVLASANSRAGQDLVAFLAGRLNARLGATLTASAHHQSRRDIDDDGWDEIAGFDRYTVRPRLWWQGASGRSVFLTGGIVHENRTGGANSFADRLETRRDHFGGIFSLPLAASATFNARWSFSSNRFDRVFGTSRIPSTQRNLFAEAAWDGHYLTHHWVLGTATARDELLAQAATGVAYRHDGVAAFAQDEFSPRSWLTLSGTLRVDTMGSVGTYLSPRLSALIRDSTGSWSLRGSLAGGFSPPTPWVEEIADSGIGVLAPLAHLRAERARMASLDLKWADEGWDVNASVFMSEIRQPLATRVAPNGQLEIINGARPLRAPGAEMLAGFTRGPWHLLGSWSAIDATEAGDAGVRVRAPRVPRYTTSLDGIYEAAGRGRWGLEFEYTGTQALRDNPYRSSAPGFLEINALAEIRLGRVGIFLNALNLTNRRQTRVDPLLRPSPGAAGNPLTEAWAPLAGRMVSFGFRAQL